MVVSSVDQVRSPPSSMPPKAAGLEASAVAPTSDGGQQNARYFSPYIQFDYELGLAIIQYRDANTGTVIRQMPSKQAVDEYRARSSGQDQSGSGASDRAPVGSQGSTASASGTAAAGEGPVGPDSSSGAAASAPTQTNASATASDGGGGGGRSLLA